MIGAGENFPFHRIDRFRHGFDRADSRYPLERGETVRNRRLALLKAFAIAAVLAGLGWGRPSRADVFLEASSSGTRISNLRNPYEPPTETFQLSPNGLTSGGDLLIYPGDGRSFPTHSADAVINFDLSTLPTQFLLNSATIGLHIRGTQNSLTTPVSLYLESFKATSATASLNDFHQPMTALGSWQLPANTPIDGSIVDIPVSMDITSQIRSYLNDGTPYIGFHLYSSATVTFSPDQTGPLSPTLRLVNSVPEPSVLSLMTVTALTAAGLGFYRLRRLS